MFLVLYATLLFHLQPAIISGHKLFEYMRSPLFFCCYF